MGQACISSKDEVTRMREEEETREEDGTNQKKGTKEEFREQPKEEGKKREGLKRVASNISTYA